MTIFTLSYIFIFMLAIEVFTAIFQISGMSRSKARFQVLSLLTNSGFKTKESELITNDNFKRKITIFIMVFTYASLLIFISSSVHIAVHSDVVTTFVYILVEIVLFYNFFTILTVKKLVYSIVDWFTKKYLLEKDVNTIKVLEEFNNKVLAIVSLQSLPEDLVNTEIQTIEQLSVLEISILAIERQNIFINSVLPNQTLNLNDKITVYGDLINIQFLFKINKI